MQQLGKFASALVGLFFLYATFLSIPDGRWYGFPVQFLAATLCFWPVQNWINKKIRIFKIPGFVFFVVALTGIIVGSLIGEEQKTSRDAKAATTAQTQRDRRVAELRANAENEFETRKDEILSEARQLADNGDHADAVKVLAKFSKIPDLDLMRLRDRSSLVLLRDELGKTPAPVLQRKAVIYAEIARLDPSDAEAKAQAEVLEKETKHLIQEAEAQAKNGQIFKSSISRFDGSHRGVEQSIKLSMKNPGSYEHVSTRFGPVGPYMEVVTVFRGTNSFGATVTNVATATVAGNEVLKMQIN